MSEDRLIRIENLRRLKLGAPGEMAAKLGWGTVSQWSDLLHNRKSFGEKLARRIEAKLNLPRGWLDATTDADRKYVSAEPSPHKTAMATGSYATATTVMLPLEDTERVLVELWRSMPDDMRPDLSRDDVRRRARAALVNVAADTPELGISPPSDGAQPAPTPPGAGRAKYSGPGPSPQDKAVREARGHGKRSAGGGDASN